jgi:hypothetical protein
LCLKPQRAAAAAAAASTGYHVMPLDVVTAARLLSCLFVNIICLCLKPQKAAAAAANFGYHVMATDVLTAAVPAPCLFVNMICLCLKQQNSSSSRSSNKCWLSCDAVVSILLLPAKYVATMPQHTPCN